MGQSAKVIPVDIARDGAEITALLRRSFSGVADQMGLTEENCPRHVAFMTRERLDSQLNRPDAHCLGIRREGAWIGFVAVAPYNDGYEITRLAVAPEHRHKGYGRMLMDAACEKARAIGLEEIGLGMINENAILKKWYEAQGFVPGEPFSVPGAPYTVCGMAKSLRQDVK